MTGSLLLPFFGLLAFLGSAVAAPAASAATNKTSASIAPKAMSLTSTLIYDLDNIGIAAPTVTSKSGVKVTSDIYIVDMAGHSAAQIAAYKAAGKTVVCYFSAGTLEPFRADATKFNPVCACGPGGKLDSNKHCVGGSGKTKMDDWDEYWLDIHSATCKTNVQSVMTQRIKDAKAKGCDGMDPDNVDSYANGAPYGNTQADQVEYLLWLAKTVRAAGMIVDLKNSADLLQSKSAASLISAFDFSVIESCHQYNECDAYSGFTKAGKPQIQIEYSNSIKKCPTLKAGQNLAVYKGLVLNSKDITLNCRGPRA